MNLQKKIIVIIVSIIALSLSLTGCNFTAPISGTIADTQKTIDTANILQSNQPTPTDINYSLERYNLIRRAYWVNGQREKANTLTCEIERPLGYIVLLTESGAIINTFIVDGKVSSLNSYLTPDSEHYSGESSSVRCRSINGALSSSSFSSVNEWLPDVDGSYGTNDNGIFFFTTDGKYIEWTGTYLYSDIPFVVESPVVRIGE